MNLGVHFQTYTQVSALGNTLKLKLGNWSGDEGPIQASENGLLWAMPERLSSSFWQQQEQCCTSNRILHAFWTTASHGIRNRHETSDELNLNSESQRSAEESSHYIHFLVFSLLRSGCWLGMQWWTAKISFSQDPKQTEIDRGFPQQRYSMQRIFTTIRIQNIKKHIEKILKSANLNLFFSYF